MGVPLLDLKAHHQPLHTEIMAAVEQTFKSQAFILGPEVGKLEERVAGYCQTKYGIGVTSGTDALLIALMSLGISQGDEVITTPIRSLPQLVRSCGLELSRCWSTLIR